MAALAAARFLHLAGTLSLAGLLVFRAAIAPADPRHLRRASLACAWAGGAAWLLCQAAVFAGGWDGAAAAVPALSLIHI